MVYNNLGLYMALVLKTRPGKHLHVFTFQCNADIHDFSFSYLFAIKKNHMGAKSGKKKKKLCEFLILACFSSLCTS